MQQMTLEKFAELCDKDPGFKEVMRITFEFIDKNKDVMRALADGAVPTEAGKAKAQAMREIVYK